MKYKYLTIFLLTIEYRLISKKGEGTFSEVLKAQSIKTGKYVAIKCMKNHFDTIE
jgi:renal tumor antigen